MTEEVQQPVYITVEKTADIINKSVHAVRQLVRRGKLTRKPNERSCVLELEEVLNYHANKKRLPSWEKNIETVTKKSFVSLDFASSTLLVQPIYLMDLIRQKTLEGYVTAAGEIMVSKDSINSYLRNPENDVTDL